MPEFSSRQHARFARLPKRSNDVWQGGLVRLPMWIDDPDGIPYRPLGGVWVSLETGALNVKMAEPAKADATLAIDALIELGLKFAQTRPSAIQVTDPALAERLARALDDPELEVSVVPRLEAIEPVLERMASENDDEPRPPAALDGKGVTVERMRAFAAAARDFFTAAPWRHLSGEDLIHVEQGQVATSFRHLTVLGRAGYSLGLGFYESAEAFNDTVAALDVDEFIAAGSWTVAFCAAWEIAIADHDLWEEHGFPLAGPVAYPMMARYSSSEGIRRPNARELADVEAILLALACTTEAEMDQGRWSHEVTTHAGPRRITMTLPDLLLPIDEPTDPRLRDPLDAILPADASPLERAQDLAYRAMDERGRRRIQLARKAIDLSADCIDAYMVLAEDSLDTEQARDLYARAMAAGERVLGPEVFASEDYPFWVDEGTQPYMRARFGLAQCLEDLNQTDEAVRHYRELLRLNPSDDQGVRYSLLVALLLASRDDDIGSLLQQYDDPTALWQYGAALWAYRREGDSPAARAHLRSAVRSNRHVPGYVTGESEWDEEFPDRYEIGSREEAVICDEELGDAWHATPGAVDWLVAHSVSDRRPKKRRR